jgi:hypothetical protein
MAIDTSSYWHISAVFSLAYASITLPTQTRTIYPYEADMYDMANHINVHGQQKIAQPDVAVLFDDPGANDKIGLGWSEVPGRQALTTMIIRGEKANVDDITKIFKEGKYVTNRYWHG